MGRVTPGATYTYETIISEEGNVVLSTDTLTGKKAIVGYNADIPVNRITEINEHLNKEPLVKPIFSRPI